jgi:hypothetical protein
MGGWCGNVNSLSLIRFTSHLGRKPVPRIGYFEGTDPLLLTKLAAEGVETLPVANTWDGHGKCINHLGKDEVNAVVGYLHKVIPAEPLRTSSLSIMLDNLLSACEVYAIPVLLIVPCESYDQAKKLLGNLKAKIELVAPEELEVEVRKYL